MVFTIHIGNFFAHGIISNVDTFFRVQVTNPPKTFSDVIESILRDHEICLGASGSSCVKSIPWRFAHKLTGIAYFQPKGYSKLNSRSCVVSALCDKAVDTGRLSPVPVAVVAATEEWKSFQLSPSPSSPTTNFFDHARTLPVRDDVPAMRVNGRAEVTSVANRHWAPLGGVLVEFTVFVYSY